MGFFADYFEYTEVKLKFKNYAEIFAKMQNLFTRK
jgi:hypothetical protein